MTANRGYPAMVLAMRTPIMWAIPLARLVQPVRLVCLVIKANVAFAVRKVKREQVARPEEMAKWAKKGLKGRSAFREISALRARKVGMISSIYGNIQARWAKMVLAMRKVQQAKKAKSVCLVRKVTKALRAIVAMMLFLVQPEKQVLPGQLAHPEKMGI